MTKEILKVLAMVILAPAALVVGVVALVLTLGLLIVGILSDWARSLSISSKGGSRNW